MCAPSPPDPKETASASTGTNVGTAVANAMLGNVNQVTNDGSLTYDQTGSHKWTDPYTKKSYTIPTFTATQTLSPEQQAIADSANQAKGNLAGLASTLSGNAQAGMENPFEFDNQDAADWAYDLGASRLDPRFAREEESIRTRLINSGIREGTAAWNAEMGRATEGKNDAYNQLMLQGRSQAYNEARDQYTLPVNTVSALLSGSQVSQPNYVNTNMPSIAQTDTAGIINDNYAQRMAQWGANSGTIGGIMGMGAQLIGLSDERTKKNKEKRGEIDGMGVYDFNYKSDAPGTPKRTGLMAQEVERQKPGAVINRNGLKYVNYSKALGG